MKVYRYISRETGEMLTAAEAREMFRTEYDGDDPTNSLGMDEYFDEIAPIAVE